MLLYFFLDTVALLQQCGKILFYPASVNQKLKGHSTCRKMTDADGPMISEAFYEHLFRGPDGTRASRPDIRKSARALHAAVQKLRSSGVEFRRWMPFVHLGRGD